MCHEPQENVLIARARTLMSAYADMEELIRIGAYKMGSDADLDEAIRLRGPLEEFLAQGREERISGDQAFALLDAALST
jgi:flagellum-specific ATP synthase